MKHYYALTLLLLCCFLQWNSAYAQTPAIMDANVAWTNSGGGSYNGALTVYMTDSTNVSGVQLTMGSQPDSSDIYSVSYTGATNGNFGNNSNVAMTNNNLSVNLGSFSYHSDYYVDIKVLLQGSSYKEIQIHSSN
jgi:hypothetical protein